MYGKSTVPFLRSSTFTSMTVPSTVTPEDTTGLRILDVTSTEDAPAPIAKLFT
ncbi:hypothetical protein D3C85_1506060 [compost metagenome]